MQTLDKHIKQIEQLMREGDVKELRIYLDTLRPHEVAEIITHIEDVKDVVLFRLLPRDKMARVFRYLQAHDEQTILRNLSNAEAGKLLADLKPDERVNVIEEMPAKITRRLLNTLGPDDRAEALKLLGYPDKSVGRLMTPAFIAVRQGWTVEKAINHMRQHARTSETINLIYVISEGWKLRGYVELNQLILAQPTQSVKSLMHTDVISLSAYDDREIAVKVLNDHRMSVIPVVDSDSTLIGIVTFDDIIDIAEEETTEDFHRSAAISDLDTSYRSAGLLQLIKSRAGWLIGLVLVNLASGGVIAAYEETLAAAITLAFFMPLLIATGGNTGSQSATLMIRAISIGELRLSHWFKAVSKELFVGLGLAVLLGAVSATLGIWRGGPEVGLIVGLSMASIVIIANLFGSLLPFILIKCKIDPAVASGPLVTSVADVMGLLIYFSIAAALLGSFV